MTDDPYAAAKDRRGVPVTAQPKPTAAAVLREHGVRGPDDYERWRCWGCDWTGDSSGHGQHQTDVLAAAGLLAMAGQREGATPTTEDLRAALNGWDDRLDFDRWLAERDAQVAAQALRQWADDVDQTYPTDVFRPVAPAWLAQVHAFCQQHGRTLDAISAHVMRNAARIARQDADRIAAT